MYSPKPQQISLIPHATWPRVVLTKGGRGNCPCVDISTRISLNYHHVQHRPLKTKQINKGTYQSRPASRTDSSAYLKNFIHECNSLCPSTSAVPNFLLPQIEINRHTLHNGKRDGVSAHILTPPGSGNECGGRMRGGANIGGIMGRRGEEVSTDNEVLTPH